MGNEVPKSKPDNKPASKATSVELNAKESRRRCKPYFLDGFNHGHFPQAYSLLCNMIQYKLPVIMMLYRHQGGFSLRWIITSAHWLVV